MGVCEVTVINCKFYPQSDDQEVCCCGRAKALHNIEPPVRVELPKARVQGFDRLFKKIGDVIER